MSTALPPEADVEAMWRWSAVEAVAALRARRTTPSQLVEAAAARMAADDVRRCNAVPTACLDRARDRARQLLARPAPPPDTAPGFLHGLPIVVKDTQKVQGVRFTYGSPLVDSIADESDPLVKRLEANGAIVLGKSNTPEYAAGGNTTNAIFGATVNPFDTSKVVGGSSGGSAAALALGIGWGATGSDLGGSLRLPAAFCNVVGLRPSPGLVPRSTQGSFSLFDFLAVAGPMARSVPDLALLLDAMVFPPGDGVEDPGSAAAAAAPALDPIALPPPPPTARSFLSAAQARDLPRRVAFSRDLGGICPVEDELAEAAAAVAKWFEEQGSEVAWNSCPDLQDAEEIFKVLRGDLFAGKLGPALEQTPELLGPEVTWNVQYGKSIDIRQKRAAHAQWEQLYRRSAQFFAEFDLLITPAVMCSPFDVTIRWKDEVAGRALDNYIEWLRFTYAITLTLCPALSLPCGRTASGLPIGAQLVGGPRREHALLSAAAAFEEAHEHRAHVPVESTRSVNG